MVAGRQHPFLSPVAVLGAAALLAAVGLSLLARGGAAFSPGELSALAAAGTPLAGYASHAAFANDCSQCHVAWQGIAAERCEACHTGVAAQRSAAFGLHANLPNAADCAACHPEHQGAAFDPAAAALEYFDHGYTRFSLARHAQDYAGQLLECAGCHSAPEYHFEPAECLRCHMGQAPVYSADHLAAFGADCLACHDGLERTSSFDHAATAWPLAGEHAALACAACHAAAVPPQQAPAECQACHREPAVHAGLFHLDCAACHTAAGWLPARLAGNTLFEHGHTGFELTSHRRNFDGTVLACAACHTGPPGTFAGFGPATCQACHAAADSAFMTGHVAQFGAACLDCHDGSGRLANFDHARVFALDGAHAALDCAACHPAQRFMGTPDDCAGCHAEPEVHLGLFGTDCAACHTTPAWLPAALRDHPFPLDHGEAGQVACATCHPASYPAYTCYTCHEHEPGRVAEEHAEEGIRGPELENCAECHPTGREDEGGGD